MANKTKIESCDYTINPVKGLCPVACSYCYAWRLYGRFKWDPTVRYDPSVFFNLPRKASRIFVGSTMELFGAWVRQDWLDDIMANCELWPEHTFLFLTKMPENLPKEWPDNCGVGVTATNEKMFHSAIESLKSIQVAVRFISVEPLVSWNTPFDYLIWESLWRAHINWLIIGQQTPVRKNTMPKWESVAEIVQAADKAGAAVFLKNNIAYCLSSVPQGMRGDVVSFRRAGYPELMDENQNLRQEFPEVKVKDHA